MRETNLNPQKDSAPPDPLDQAVRSANRDHWTLRPPEDVRRMVCRAITEYGRDKQFWVMECLRAGLAKYAAKKDQAPRLVKPTTLAG